MRKGAFDALNKGSGGPEDRELQTGSVQTQSDIVGVNFHIPPCPRGETRRRAKKSEGEQRIALGRGDGFGGAHPTGKREKIGVERVVGHSPKVRKVDLDSQFSATYEDSTKG